MRSSKMGNWHQRLACQHVYRQTAKRFGVVVAVFGVVRPHLQSDFFQNFGSMDWIKDRIHSSPHHSLSMGKFSIRDTCHWKCRIEDRRDHLVKSIYFADDNIKDQRCTMTC